MDYPPFAWGSGMGWKAVSYSQAEALGVIPADWSPPPQSPPESPNASLQSNPAIADRALRNEISSRLRGLAEWRKDTLVFTDPNGSRPTAPEALVATWAKGMPDAFHDLPGKGLMQQQSALRWIADHEDLRDANDQNVWDDLLRLATRLISRPVEHLYRGMAMSTEKLDEFLRLLEPKIYQTRREYPLESWTDSPAAAANYARTGGKGWSVLLSVAKPTRAADFSAFARAYSGRITKQTSPPLVTESEWVYTTGRKFKVLATTKDTSTRTVRIELEERP